MKVLIVDAFAKRPISRDRFKQFYAIIKKAFKEHCKIG